MNEKQRKSLEAHWDILVRAFTMDPSKIDQLTALDEEHKAKLKEDIANGKAHYRNDNN